MGTIIANKKKGPIGVPKRAACRPPVPRAGRGRRAERPLKREKAPEGLWRCGRPGGRTALRESVGSRPSGGPGTLGWSRGARPISGARLRASRPLHLRPINQVVSLGPYRREGPSRGRLPA